MNTKNKISITLFTLGSLAMPAMADFHQPVQVLMTEENWARRTVFSLDTKVEGAFSISHYSSSLRKLNFTTFYFKNIQNEIVAKAHQKFFTSYNYINLVDKKGISLGSIVEKNDPETKKTYLSVQDGQDVEVAVGVKSFVMKEDQPTLPSEKKKEQKETKVKIRKHTLYTFADLRGVTVAVVEQTIKRKRAEWKFTFLDTNIAHPFLLFALAAFDTQAAHSRKTAIIASASVLGTAAVIAGAAIAYKKYNGASSPAVIAAVIPTAPPLPPGINYSPSKPSVPRTTEDLVVEREKMGMGPLTREAQRRMNRIERVAKPSRTMWELIFGRN